MCGKAIYRKVPAFVGGNIKRTNLRVYKFHK
jgi:hypothetical protein